ncbi:unnamed protein product, partial [Mesorhabditis belari]|uniref:Lysozyme n=1 Tax=Mesorhabditis belari TaxID=2138241 RepID=A0AAF3JA96_9BILA
MRFLLLLSLLGFAFCKTGIDSISAISTSTFTCLKNNGYSFFVFRVWRQVNNYDDTGIQNILNARAAGITDVDGYIYPCTSSSCPPGANQVEAVIDKLNEKGAKIGMLWLDVEGTWPSDKTKNQQFIQGMADAAVKKGVKVGVYTGQYSWPDIVGSWTGMSKYPLWWPNYNNDPGFGKYPPYGGWTKPLVHQYGGDLTTRPCGLGDMDINYKD